MILSAKSILNLKLIPSGLGEFGALAQCGIDLSVKNIRRIKGGKIFQNGKDIDEYEELDFYTNKNNNKIFVLPNGVYSLEFDQDIKLDKEHSGIIVGRSTTNRCGCLIRSSWFDTGFSCDSIGATLYVLGDNVVEIEEHSRLAQLIVFKTEESDEYNGSYFGSNDIK